ncbi:MAG: exopolyphosphatase [Herpetosiphonaceae bacterium]|nr:MAG: exopolyphosphatase [Herpetosiphonaceae bacterium]
MVGSDPLRSKSKAAQPILKRQAVNERLGIIDLGSNSARMVVFQYQPHLAFTQIDDVKETVRLAHGIGDDNLLQQETITRAAETLTMFTALGKSLGLPRLIAVATSAVRDAANQPAFLAHIKETAGIDLRVLSGEEEAYYGYLGAVNSLSFSDGFIFDIGGGSMQLSLVRGRGLVRSISLPLGTIRLFERFLSTDRPSAEQLSRLESYLQEQLSTIEWFGCLGAMQLVGMGGTVRNLAKIDQEAQGYPLDKLHGYEIPIERVEEIAAQLALLSTQERQDIPGLSRDRADTILPGVILIRSLMRYSGCRSLLISGHGLREGLFYEQFLAGARPPLIADVRAFGIENLARRYECQRVHAAKVRDLSLQLFDQLQPLHGYGAWERELLAAAALIHDIGIAINYYDHHKHGLYLILNSFLPGYSHREIILIALLTRYHRKGTVKLGAFESVLSNDDEQRIARLSALLRIAEYLERGKSQVVQGLRCSIADGLVRVEVVSLGDATMEIWAANQKTRLFRKAYGYDINMI